MNKIYGFDALKRIAEETGEDASRIVGRFWRRFQAKALGKRPLLTLVNPWGEVNRLRAFIDAMRHEEWLAAKNALDLYAENEILRQYKTLADGHMGQFVPIDDHNKVKKDLATTREKLSRAYEEFHAQHEEWMKSIGLIPKRQK